MSNYFCPKICFHCTVGEAKPLNSETEIMSFYLLFSRTDGVKIKCQSYYFFNHLSL